MTFGASLARNACLGDMMVDFGDFGKRVRQECHTRVSHKSVLQEPRKSPTKSVPQECLTRVSYNSAPQECPTRAAHKSPARVSYKSAPQEGVCHTRVSHKYDVQECPTRVSYKSASQECTTRVSLRTGNLMQLVVIVVQMSCRKQLHLRTCNL